MAKNSRFRNEADPAPGFQQATSADFAKTFAPPFNAMHQLGDPRDALVHAPKATQHLRDIENSADAAFAGSRELQQANLDDIARQQELRREINRLTGPFGGGGAGFNPDNPQVVRAQRQWDRIAAERAARDPHIETHAAKAGALNGARDAILRALRNVPPGKVLVDLDVALPEQRKGEHGPLDTLERLRRRLRELDAEAHREQSRPITRETAMAKVKAQIDALARGIDFADAIEVGGAGMRLPMKERKHLKVYNLEGTAVIGTVLTEKETVDATALLFSLFRDVITAQAEADIVRDADEIEDGARAAKLAEIAADKLATEYEEAALVRHLLGQGISVLPRHDADPMATLSTTLADASPGK